MHSFLSAWQRILRTSLQAELDLAAVQAAHRDTHNKQGVIAFFHKSAIQLHTPCNDLVQQVRCQLQIRELAPWELTIATSLLHDWADVQAAIFRAACARDYPEDYTDRVCARMYPQQIGTISVWPQARPHIIKHAPVWHKLIDVHCDHIARANAQRAPTVRCAPLKPWIQHWQIKTARTAVRAMQHKLQSDRAVFVRKFTEPRKRLVRVITEHAQDTVALLHSQVDTSDMAQLTQSLQDVPDLVFHAGPADLQYTSPRFTAARDQTCQWFQACILALMHHTARGIRDVLLVLKAVLRVLPRAAEVQRCCSALTAMCDELSAFCDTEDDLVSGASAVAAVGAMFSEVLPLDTLHILTCRAERAPPVDPDGPFTAFVLSVLTDGEDSLSIPGRVRAMEQGMAAVTEAIDACLDTAPAPQAPALMVCEADGVWEGVQLKGEPVDAVLDFARTCVNVDLDDHSEYADDLAHALDARCAALRGAVRVPGLGLVDVCGQTVGCMVFSEHS